MLRKEKWRRGVGSTLYGVFIMLLCTTMCLFFVQTVKVQQEFQDTQLAADSIADATAVYASNEVASYEEAVAYAADVQNMVAEKTGTRTTNLVLDREQYEEENKADVKVGLFAKMVDVLFDFNTPEEQIGRQQEMIYEVRAGAATEFTNAGTDYVQWMIDIANDDRHGYCQYAGFPMGNGIVSTGRYFNPDVDCSSFVYYALKNTGYDIGNTVFATGGMETALTRAGFHKIPYSNSGLIEGDILWNPNHTEVYIGNGMTVGAHSSETGGINGRPGDQTGEEVSVAPNSNSWIFIYRK